jgi:hypothetical protein
LLKYCVMFLSRLLTNTLFLLLPMISLTQITDHPEPITLAIGKMALGFNLKGTDGKMYSLNSFTKAKALVIIFSANHCPTAQAYEDRIIALTKDYKPIGLEVAVISSNYNEVISLSELGYTALADGFKDMKSPRPGGHPCPLSRQAAHMTIWGFPARPVRRAYDN